MNIPIYKSHLSPTITTVTTIANILTLLAATFLIMTVSSCAPVKEQIPVTPPTPAQIVRWTYNAETLSKQGNYLEAAKELQNIIQVPQENDKYYLLTGQYFELADSPREALQTYKKGIQDLPLNSSFLLNYHSALLLASIDQLEETMKIADSLLMSQEKMDILGLIEFKQNRVKKAHQNFAQALQMPSTANSSGWVHLHMAMNYLKAGLIDESGNSLFKSISSVQNSPLLTQQIKDFWEIQKQSKKDTPRDKR